MEKRKIELLAPGGDIDAIKAAILAGANAVYCGLDKFNARNRAANISFDDLQGILRLAHQNDCEVFLTLNIIILENEIPSLITLLNKLVNTSIDGVIVQDLGMLYLLFKYFKRLKIHASTQFTTHNQAQIKFLSRLNSTRVNLSRELNIKEIQKLSEFGHQHQVQTEVFVHGSNCISFSGLCYISSVQTGNSGNRGRCSQPCRDRYERTAEGKEYPLNLKDNSAWYNLKELYDAGVYSLKIEGRIKKYDYVYSVVDAWKKHIQTFFKQNEISDRNSILYKVFNRDFSNTLLKGDINKDMFIDNPRDHSILHLSEINKYNSDEELEKDRLKLYAEKEDIKASIESKIKQVNAIKAPLKISLSGKCSSPLKVRIATPDKTFVVESGITLSDKGTQELNYNSVIKRFKAFNETEYFIDKIDFEGIKSTLYLPFKELTSLKKKILFILNDSRENLEPVVLPKLNRSKVLNNLPRLSILISSENDIEIGTETSADIYFQLPNCFGDKLDQYLDLFRKNNQLIPWFPSLLIDENFDSAVRFLEQLQPKLIVTNNTGIAQEAYEKGIDWIAGPQLNVVNSYSLLALKENLNCSGSFISNEINKNQIKAIKSPENFKLFYSIYHPIVLMTSRQCLFHQVTGCHKNKIDDTCIQNCVKSSTIVNSKNESLFLEKTEGNYHNIYNETNFLNTDIVSDLPETFSNFFIDLRDITSKTKIDIDKAKLIKLFEDLCNGNQEAETQIKQVIYPTTNVQYKRGI
ncbi:U32 family peptidase [Marinifilum sp. N1E240]|uniref:peptidase U32 family protein n=1 Tax=Marinifilum sp. N1E240 TaxID=2608082 RepID=UPI00128CE5E1|nr:peptidase U32 family protein [Marinifilum sp. N1E240]MPQ49221.1 U32 family peptidase [Marinifilum sp. N1E240]